MNVAEFMESYMKLEHDRNFFDISVGGVKPWKFLRYNMYYVCLQKLYGYPEGFSETETLYKRVPNKKIGNLVKVLRTKPNLEEYYDKYITSFLKRRDYLILMYANRIKNGKYWEEPYLEDFVDLFPQNSYYVFEWGYNICRWADNPKTANLKYISDEFIYMKRKGEYIDFKFIYKCFVEMFIKPIEEYFKLGIEAEFGEKIYHNLYVIYSREKAYLRLYRRVLKKVKPKFVFCYNSASIAAQFLIEAARSQGVKVVEVQHGVVHGEGITCSCIGNIGKTLVPDYYLAYSQYWAENFVHAASKVVPIGNPKLLKNTRKYSKKIRAGKIHDILLISSEDGIARLAYELYCALPKDKYRIMLKLHGFECKGWEERYPYLLNTDIRVISDFQKNIYYWISKSDIVIGKGSTGLYDAILFPVIKVTVSTEENLYTDAAKDGIYEHATTVEEVCDIIEENRPKEYGKEVLEKYISFDAKKNLMAFLKKGF